MEQKSVLSQRERCRHQWIDLGYSPRNGKIYKRCAKCSLIKEYAPEYVS